MTRAIGPAGHDSGRLASWQASAACQVDETSAVSVFGCFGDHCVAPAKSRRLAPVIVGNRSARMELELGGIHAETQRCAFELEGCTTIALGAEDWRW